MPKINITNSERFSRQTFLLKLRDCDSLVFITFERESALALGEKRTKLRGGNDHNSWQSLKVIFSCKPSRFKPSLVSHLVSRL